MPRRRKARKKTKSGSGGVKVGASNATSETSIQTCNYCKSTFATLQSLYIHIVTHTTMYQCEVCNKTFMIKARLEEHRSRKHSLEGGLPRIGPNFPKACLFCGESFISKTKLNEHFLIHASEEMPRQSLKRTSDGMADTLMDPSVDNQAQVDNSSLATKTSDELSNRFHKCNYCGRSFLDEGTLVSHLLTHTTMFQCEICKKTHTSKKSLLAHLKREHSLTRELSRKRPNAFKTCLFCGESWKIRDLNKHFIIHASEDTIALYQCHICGEKFSSKVKQKIHEKKDHSREHFPCGECGKSFKVFGSFLRHKRTHRLVNGQNKETFSCDYCGKPYKTFGRLVRHKKSHQGMTATPYKTMRQCFVCDETFLNESLLKVHCANHTEDEVKGARKKFQNRNGPFICPLCGKGMTTNYSLKMHMRLHTGEKRFQCHVCHKKCVRKSDLKDHFQRCHATTPPTRKHMCTKCGKLYLSASQVKHHELTVHKKERPCMCSVCGKSFGTKPCLSIHMRIHTGEKPYKCKMCDKEFRHLYYMKIHARTHTGERPFSCIFCKKSFYSSSILREHVKNVHDMEHPFSCCHCGKAFLLEATMKRHMKLQGCGGNSLEPAAQVQDPETGILNE